MTNGIHHVTAIAGPARRNLDFYTRVLGLRLVKKTVNFDDPGTYHLYYGDETGRPGTILTNLLHFGMVLVGLPYAFQGQMRLDEVTGGAPYGATTIAGGDGSRQPSENELEGARFLGRHVAETAAKMVAADKLAA